MNNPRATELYRHHHQSEWNELRDGPSGKGKSVRISGGQLYRLVKFMCGVNGNAKAIGR